ncbi:hypothetical protein OAD75_06345 [Gammaproteobacteria bacterium]|nr:hypothetical protein [Gammaproteobacteria bacterium]
MENLNHYFSDAEENISNEFMSANGEYSDWDDAFDFGGSEEEYLNAMGSADASSSQPYIISLYNSSAADLSNVEVGGAYNNITTTVGDKANTLGIAYTMGISGVTYLEFLWQSSSKPFVVGLTYLQSDGGSASVLETITVKVVDSNGNQQQKTLVPTIDPYQNQTDITVLKHTYKWDGFTTLTVNKIATTRTLKVYLYPSETVSQGRALTGNSIARGYGNPNVVRQDKIVLGQGVARALQG